MWEKENRRKDFDRISKVLTINGYITLKLTGRATLHYSGVAFGPDDDGHYAYIDTEELIGTTIELIERPKRRNPPEKVYPPEMG